MSHRVVKILTSDAGDERDDTVWCLAVSFDGTDRTFCGGEAFGFGESGCEYELKTVEKGGITCDACKDYIKKIKSVKL